MSCSGIPISSSNISCLDFTTAWDISGAQPIVTITNNSTIANYANLKWWFYVTSPSGTSIYGVDINSASPLPTPDVNGVTWATKVINLPTPFGNLQCGQIEFSRNSPFNVTVFVEDITLSPPGTFFSYTKGAVIVRPNGNTQNTCGSFGAARIDLQVNCASRSSGIVLFDGTSLVYNNILAPAVSTNKWTLVYPQAENGSIPNQIASNAASVSFPITVNSDAYTIYFQEYATYNYGNGVTVKVQYKLYSENNTLGRTFSINCNTNLCQLQCQMSKLRELAKGSCGTVENANVNSKLVAFTAIYTEILTGIFQPLCGINVPALIKEAEKIAGFDGNCDCGCDGDNFGFSNPVGGPDGGGCCPVSSDVIDNGTGLAPANCPLGYFPAQVKDPTNSTVIGTANNMNDLIGIVNANEAWQAYGIAFAEGNCKVGWFAAIGSIPPNVFINQGGTVIPPLAYVDDLIDINTGIAPVGCPTGNPYPLKVYDATATTVIGIANSIANVVSLLNGDASWQAYGVASVQDTCHVQFNLTNPSSLPPAVKVDPDVTGSACTSNTANFLVYMIDPCFPNTPISSSSFPCSLFFDFGLGAGSQPGGIVNSFAEIVNVLNYHGAGGSPVQLTFSLGTAPDSLQVVNSDCSAYPYTPTIYCNAGSNSFILLGANFTDMIGTTPTLNGAEGLGLANSSFIGRIPGSASNKHMWHTIHISNYCIVAEGDTGKIYFYDISNPLYPTLARVIQLNDTGSGNCFTGLPNSKNYQSPNVAQPSYFSLYFPTDYYGTLGLGAIPVCEGTTGSLWLINFYGGTVINSTHQNQLLGKCPRIVTGTTNNWLLWLTQDGDLEQAAGLSSGVAIGHISIVTFSSAGAFSYADQQIFSQQEYVWAASYDGTGLIYFSGNKGSVYSYDITTLGRPSILNSNIFGSSGVFTYRLNTSCFGGNLYFAALNLSKLSPPSQHQPLQIATTASLLASAPVISHIDVVAAGEASVNTFFNVQQLGGCLLAVVMAGGATPQVIVIFRSNGDLVGAISNSPDLGVHQYFMFNFIAIPNYRTYTPNSFIIP